MMRIGILSDTHGTLREPVLRALEGCDVLLHAGDVGDPAILARLAALAPLHAVRGNTDHGPGVGDLPDHWEGDIGGVDVRVVHRREDIPAAWKRPGVGLIVIGHSHRPELEWYGDLLLLNPGACGTRRFKLPLTVGVVTVVEARLVPEILAVEDG